MKRAAVLILIPLILTGCGHKEEINLQKLSRNIIPNHTMSEKFMEAVDYPEEAREQIRKVTEIHKQASREILSDLMSREFSPEELNELNEIYSSELVVRLQDVLTSDEYMIASMELAKPRIEEMEQNQRVELEQNQSLDLTR